MGIQKVEVTRGVAWIEVPEVGLRVLCGCPADAVKHLIKRGLIQYREIGGVKSETGPNAILLSDQPVQNGEFANLAEFPVLQMLYKQGLLLPGHPNNTGRKPLLIGAADQIECQMRYIYRGNYGLVSREEIIQTGMSPEQADEIMRLKLAFAYGKIRPTREFLDKCIVEDDAVEILGGVTIRRERANVFEFSYGDERVTVDLNLALGETYECPYPLGYRRFEPEYFSVIHSGEGDGWDVNRPSMSSIITFQGKIYLIDAGPQLSHIIAALGISIDQVDGIFHTHAHDDHFAGLTVLMRARRRIRYYATPLVKASVAKKLTALLGLGEDRFDDFFDARPLPFDTWTDVDGLEVKPIFSPHPVETSIFVFRTLWGSGYRSYGHFADIVSLDVLERMVTDQANKPGLSREAFERVRAAYAIPVDVKKLDVGGGAIHGMAADFANDESKRILLAHRAGDLTTLEKEIGSSASFGTTDVLVYGESNGLRRNAFGYLEAHLPGVPLHQLRLLVNHPVAEINPGAIIVKEGEVPQEVLLLLSGMVERICTRVDVFGTLSAGALIGDGAILAGRPSNSTYRASSFLQVMRIPPSIFIEVVERNRLQARRQRGAELRASLEATELFSDGIPVSVLGKLIGAAEEHTYQANEEISKMHLGFLNVILSGRVERTLGDRRISLLEARDYFGAAVAVLKLPQVFQLRALEKTTVLQIPGSLLDGLPFLRWKFLEANQMRVKFLLHDQEMPGRFRWNDMLSIQIAPMDQQHQELINLANAVLDHLGAAHNRPGMVSALDALADYARVHFADEEAVMARTEYPDAPVHTAEHAGMMRELLWQSQQMCEEVAPSKAVFQRFFEGWIIQHIMDADMKFGRFVGDKNEP